MARNILVVEDDRNISDLIRMYLEKEGFDVRIAYDGGKAVEEFDREAPDMVLLDIMLPVMDGWAVCAHIREKAKTPIIMLTARSEDADKLMGFACGADDYVTKPFNILELKARIKALLRRARGPARPGRNPALLTAGDLSLDTEQRVAIRDGRTIDLTAKEYDLILVPSDSFGVPGYFRMAYCIDTEKVKRSIPVFEKFAHEVYGL